MRKSAKQEAFDTTQTDDVDWQRCRVCNEDYPGDYVVCPRDSTPFGQELDTEDALIGSVLGGTYQLSRILGRGGMGQLYEATHARLDRSYAVKVLHESQARSRDAIRRFAREARALSRIRSDHVLSVVDILRTSDGRDAIVTERLEGEDLKARLDRVGKLGVEEAIPLCRQVCRGLAAAHAEGIVHRDLKPSNLFLDTGADGRSTIKILDFGVAKLRGEAELTRTGAVVGTPAYMAPEQARGSAKVDERADVYAVGAVLYRMLTGRPPYSGDEPAALLASLLHEQPKRPRAVERSIPIGLEAVIQRTMAREPDDRPSDVHELERELAAFDSQGEAPGLETWEATDDRGEASTLILPRGSVSRARRIAKRAARARPTAVLLSLTASSAVAALTALLVVAIQSLGSMPRTSVEGTASWLLSAAAGIAACAFAARWLGRHWSNLPDVMRFDHVLLRALLAASSALGAIELVLRAHDALAAVPTAAEPFAMLGRVAVVVAVAVVAGWDTTRKPTPITD